jgi:phosphoglycolate phosphatase
MDFEGVIFDLDGTLADTREDLADAMNRVLAGEGLPVHEHAAFGAMIGGGLRNLVTSALPVDRRDDDTIARCAAAMMVDYGRHCLVKTRLYDGVAETVSRLRADGVRLAVLSNKPHELTKRIVSGLLGCSDFEQVLGARPDTPAKPDPTAALLLAARLACAPRRIVFLGDTAIDMATATAAGMIAVGASWGFRTDRELLDGGATAVLAHPLELLELRRGGA